MLLTDSPHEPDSAPPREGPAAAAPADREECDASPRASVLAPADSDPPAAQQVPPSTLAEDDARRPAPQPGTASGAAGKAAAGKAAAEEAAAAEQAAKAAAEKAAADKAAAQKATEKASVGEVADIVGAHSVKYNFTNTQVHLPQEKSSEFIDDALKGTTEFREGGVLTSHEPGLVLVDRETPSAESRLGLTVALDQELSDFKPQSQALAAERTSMARLYDFELVENSGFFVGHLGSVPQDVDRAAHAPPPPPPPMPWPPGIFRKRHGAGEEQGPIPLAVCDGNHPLATAKKDPEEVKTGVEGTALGIGAEAVSGRAAHPTGFLTSPLVSSGGMHSLPRFRSLLDKMLPCTTDLLGALVNLKPFEPIQTMLAVSMERAVSHGRGGPI